MLKRFGQQGQCLAVETLTRRSVQMVEKGQGTGPPRTSLGLEIAPNRTLGNGRYLDVANSPALEQC